MLFLEKLLIRNLQRKSIFEKNNGFISDLFLKISNQKKSGKNLKQIKR
jgi:hypothetical protein